MSRSTTVKPTWPLYLLFFLVAGIVGATISWGFLSESLEALGIPDPGPLTTAGLPFFRSGALMLMCLSVGSFYFAAFLTSPTPSQGAGIVQAPLRVDGALASRTGGIAALCTSLIALLLVPMYLSDVSGEPLSQALQPANWSVALNQVSTSLAWLWVAIIAAITGVGGLAARRWGSQPLLVLSSLGMLVPLGLEGHSATGGDHDYGTNSYLWHLFFMALWVGGLIALIAHGMRKGPDMATAVRRYSGLALVSALAMTASGLINAAIRIHLSDWLTTGYGLLITAKFVGVIILALFGFYHRKITIPKLDRQPALFRRVAIVEVAIMAAIAGIAVSLGRTPPPPPRSADINTMDVELGYKLFVAPTLSNVFTMWRFDIVFGTLAIVLAALYLRGVIILKRRGESWPLSRTLWFMGGCLMLLITMCSGIGMYMPALFSMHMVGHMILSMGVPVFWVLGGPLTLALRSIDAGEPHQWVEALIDNPLIRMLTIPWVNTIQFVVFFYGLYLEPLYTTAISEHAGHLGMNVLFLLSGTIYFWELIGIDPLPGRGGPMGRIVWLTGSLPFHMFFGVALMQMQLILGLDFYSILGLPWSPDLLRDQNAGGGIAWASGQFPLVIVYAVLLREFYRDDRRQQKAYDKHAEDTGDEDLEAYNQMLADMSSGKDTFRQL